ncbi:DUF6055 domain-containing protein [Plebeiibacterium marinum]|uniref:DUF6055 domain-containing protein n=1 Tax=Plebeiibacterium marinum TaxID=2992111 RepID=A0AAE3MCZ4_9BACT|nr:DUF6055 domain-containing protein [Plebeiobacterium marinum]MCW3805384.1 DUF6055 domain-containing protein [Plebeiobacterium marinum]
MKLSAFSIVLFFLMSIHSAGFSQSMETPVKKEADRKIYIPQEFKESGFDDPNNKWSYKRSKQSDHFIAFWEAGYGENNPNSNDIPEEYRVDIDDMLLKAEEFYALNINKLQFANVGSGKSNLDKYKMIIMLHYTTEWMAFGAGYDDVIGALWVSPSTCKPVGSVIAHEIGHSFQYQVYADLLANGDVKEDFTRGFRYGFGGNGGNGFWEQTAQWQAMQCYPDDIFNKRDLDTYIKNCHRHVCHEDYRYSSYFIHYYWIEKHGVDFIGKLWRSAQKPEDPFQAYMRITDISAPQLNDEIYEAASKMVTWDIDGLREGGKENIGKYKSNTDLLEDGTYQVEYNSCPGTTGFNALELEVPGAGKKITAYFKGIVNADGYNTVEDTARAGWRYGYVALLENGKRVYSKMNAATQGAVTFKVPKKCSQLWFVVTGAPKTYAPHPWDEDESNDDQWPYQVKFDNTTLL